MYRVDKVCTDLKQKCWLYSWKFSSLSRETVAFLFWFDPFSLLSKGIESFLSLFTQFSLKLFVQTCCRSHHWYQAHLTHRNCLTHHQLDNLKKKWFEGLDYWFQKPDHQETLLIATLILFHTISVVVTQGLTKSFLAHALSDTLIDSLIDSSFRY